MPMKSLPIIWQRLVDANGQTCDRCGSTYEEPVRAVNKLGASLRPPGIEPVVEVSETGTINFITDPSKQNRIWIDEAPPEE